MSPKKSYRSAVPSFACRGEKPTTSGDGGAGLRLQELDDSTVFVVDKMGKDGSFRSLRERRSNRTVTAAEFEQTFGSSLFIRQMMQRVEDSDRSIRAGLATKQILQIVATSFPSAVLACDAEKAAEQSMFLLLFMTYICFCSHERNFTVLPNECTPSVFFITWLHIHVPRVARS
jgi:hypothetical protein